MGLRNQQHTPFHPPRGRIGCPLWKSSTRPLVERVGAHPGRRGGQSKVFRFGFFDPKAPRVSELLTTMNGQSYTRNGRKEATRNGLAALARWSVLAAEAAAAAIGCYIGFARIKSPRERRWTMEMDGPWLLGRSFDPLNFTSMLVSQRVPDN